MTERTEWVDYAKGIGIILVAYAHLLSSGYHAKLAIPDVFFHLSDSIIYSFHMPLFFFLAGLFVDQSYTKRGPGSFFVNKLITIAYPYFVWSFLQVGVELFFSRHSQRGIMPADFLAIPYLPWSQFWFLYALLLMFTSYTVVQYFGRFQVTVMILGACAIFLEPFSTEIMALHGFSTGFLFFVFGVLGKKYLWRFERYRIPGIITCILLLILTGGGYFIFTNLISPMRLTNGAHPFLFLFLAGVGIFFCIGLAQHLDKQKCCRVIKTLGRYSLQIYLVHMLAGVGARIVLWDFFHIQSPLVHMIVGMGAGLSVPIILYKIALRINFPYFFKPGRDKRLEVTS
ncbi:MAG: acyltransferase [Pseudomonadota bacterium]